MILDTFLPESLSIGISEEAFWELNVSSLRPYIKADKMRLDRRNYELWLQGAYFYEAISVALANSFSKNSHAKYAEQPYPLTAEDAEAQRVERMKKMEKRFSILAEQFNNNKVGGE